MAEDESERGFQVRDRRGRPEAEPSAPDEGRRGTRQDRVEVRPEPPRPQERSLVGLFMMLASLALAALEGVQDPATGQRRRDPGQAADLIDMLMLLRDKTGGHRTPEESQALETLIHDLQLRYVKATSRPG
jgi:hypothetical protein